MAAGNDATPAADRKQAAVHFEGTANGREITSKGVDSLHETFDPFSSELGLSSNELWGAVSARRVKRESASCPWDVPRPLERGAKEPILSKDR